MRTTKRGQFAALAVGLVLVAAACGSDSKSAPAVTAGATTAPAASTAETTAGTTAETTAETTAATTAASTAGTPAPTDSTAGTTPPPATLPTGATAMTITYDIDPKAVWEDGSPITVADFDCTWRASVLTPGSISSTGYDKITAVKAGSSDKQVVVTLNKVYAPYRNLFGGTGLIKKAAVANCEDISGDFATEFPLSGREWKLQSWSESQSVLVPNDKYWGTQAKGQIVMVPKADSDTEIASLKSGEVDFIYPQYFAGITDALADPNIKTKIEFGGDYEALYFNEKEGRIFSDPKIREAFYKSIDLDSLFQQIYIPIIADGKLLTCGPIVPGDYCPSGIFGNKFDQAAADKIMTDDGYAKDGSGLWAKGGKTVDIKWMINAGNKRRENTQAFLIPLLKAAGFNVTADNCEAECVFQQRLPGGDYDLAMYISTAPPDPSYLIPAFAKDQIPTEANGNTGQNFQWWANDAATTALNESDKELDPAKRAALIQTAIKEMDKDYVLVPTFQFPKSGAYRSDKVDNVEGQLNNYRAFNDFATWKDVDGDGKIVIGAEQWPGCLNPITQCANSSWYVWTIAFPLAPSVYDTTNDNKYVITNLVTGEPKVELAK